MTQNSEHYRQSSQNPSEIQSALGIESRRTMDGGKSCEESSDIAYSELSEDTNACVTKFFVTFFTNYQTAFFNENYITFLEDDFYEKNTSLRKYEGVLDEFVNKHLNYSKSRPTSFPHVEGTEANCFVNKIDLAIFYQELVSTILSEDTDRLFYAYENKDIGVKMSHPYTKAIIVVPGSLINDLIVAIVNHEEPETVASQAS